MEDQPFRLGDHGRYPATRFMGFEQSGTILEFYEDLAKNAGASQLRLAAKEMTNLLTRVTELHSANVWRLGTSHDTLNFSVGEYPTPVSISVCSTVNPLHAVGGFDESTGHFQIEYRMRPDEEPWPDSWVKIHVRNVAQALAALEIAMERCFIPPIAG